MPIYVSKYPPAHSTTYVKATNTAGAGFEAHLTTDPALPLTGNYSGNEWYTDSPNDTNQRFHIDLGSGKVIKRIYYENRHNSGTQTEYGAKNFTFWGSNTEASFLELTYTTDTGWTQITAAAALFDEHVAEDIVDPKYITVTNSTAYRYYAFKIADNYGGGGILIRRLDLQMEVTPLVLTSTSNIVISTTASLGRGITGVLTSTSAIVVSITGRLKRIRELTSTSVIVISITSALSRGITEILTSTSNIITSTTASLSRGVKGILTSTSNIITSTTASLSRGVTQALTSTINITTSLLGRLRYSFWEGIKKSVTYTEPQKTKPTYTEPSKGTVDYTEPSKK